VKITECALKHMPDILHGIMIRDYVKSLDALSAMAAQYHNENQLALHDDLDKIPLTLSPRGRLLGSCLLWAVNREASGTL